LAFRSSCLGASHPGACPDDRFDVPWIKAVVVQTDRGSTPVDHRHGARLDRQTAGIGEFVDGSTAHTDRH